MVTSHVSIELLMKMIFHITDCDHVLTFIMFMRPIIVSLGPEMGSTPQN